MATIAKASINLVSISDAYSVSLQPSNITINADAYGKNPKLDNAFSIISLYCGDDQVEILSGNIIASSMGDTDLEKYATLSKVNKSLKLQITGINESELDGWREIEIFTKAGQRLIARFSYTIVRETSMLDWILEWNKNYTEITGDHVASPNALIGGKNQEGLLSGVYIGADMPGHPIGIYAVKDCSPEAFIQGNIESTEIFRLNENGGMIGGWEISRIGLITHTDSGKLEILSQGTIHHLNNSNPETPFWELKYDGSGSLANGNIFWDSKGDATFNGTLKTKDGEIGGWSIKQGALFNQSILIDSANNFIGIRNSFWSDLEEPGDKNAFYNALKQFGGIVLHYSGYDNFGLEGWAPNIYAIPITGKKIFSFGSENFIACWQFNSDALYTGQSPINTAGKYTNNSGEITIGSAGIRGWRWYLDFDGEVDFMNGKVHFGPTKSEISGWSIKANCLSTPHSVLVSDQSYAGLFLSTESLEGIDASALIEQIYTKGGIYMSTNGSDKVELAGYQGSDVVFKLTSSGTCLIAGWMFNTQVFWSGMRTLRNNYTSYDNSLVIAPEGIHAPKWYLLADGSGAMAGGNITWDQNGVTKLSDKVYLSWDDNSQTGTTISKDGVFSGKIKADNIEAGTISAVTVQCKDKWSLAADGSGYLAAKNIEWQSDGTLNVKANITVQQLDFNLNLTPGGPSDTAYSLTKAFYWHDIDATRASAYHLPYLQSGVCRMVYVFLYTESQSFNGEIVFTGDNNSVLIAMGNSNTKPDTSVTIRPLSQGDTSVLGLYQLVGVNVGDTTVWRIFKIG